METKIKSVKRIDYIDILRGIGILVMIMGHVGFGGKFDRYIHSFHMPLFFFVSGYLFKMKQDFEVKSYILKKIRQLIVPYLFFGIVHYIIWLIITPKATDVLEPLVKTFTYNTEGLPIAGALWFFTALFFADVLYTLIMHYIKNPLISGSIIMIFSLGMSTLTTLTSFRLPLTLDIAIVATGFLYVGGLLRKFSDKYALTEKIAQKPYKYFGIGLVLFILNGGLSFINGYVNVKSGWYDIVPLSWANAIIGFAALFIFSVCFDNFFRLLKKPLVFIGKNSIVYLCLNQLVILMAVRLIGTPIGNMGDVNVKSLAISIVIFVLSTAVLSLAVFLFNNTPLKRTIGK